MHAIFGALGLAALVHCSLLVAGSSTPLVWIMTTGGFLFTWLWIRAMIGDKRRKETLEEEVARLRALVERDREEVEEDDELEEGEPPHEHPWAHLNQGKNPWEQDQP